MWNVAVSEVHLLVLELGLRLRLLDLLLLLLQIFALLLLLKCVCVNLESKASRDKGLEGAGRAVLRMHCQKHVRERCAKVGTVNVEMPGGLGCVGLIAARAVELDNALAGKVRHADREDPLILTQNARAAAEIPCLVLGQHALQPPVGNDVSGVDEAVHLLGSVLNVLDLVIAKIFLLVLVENQLQGSLVVGHQLRQTGQVELVLNIGLFYLSWRTREKAGTRNNKLCRLQSMYVIHPSSLMKGYRSAKGRQTSQKNSLPRREQYQEIHENSSEELIVSEDSVDESDSSSIVARCQSERYH